MRFHHLRALVTIADTGSFTAAADQLGISQSSLSHAITELELELELRVFERGRQGAQSTEAGRRVLPHARQVLASMNSIHAEAHSMAGLLSGRVRIGSVPSVAIAFIPRVMAEFAREYPNVEIVLLEEPSQGMQQLIEWLRSNTIDLAVLELPANGLNVVPLTEDELCAIVPASSPLARRKHLSILDLANEPFVMSRYNSERLIRSAYAQHELVLPVRFEVQDLGTLMSIVREGLGISIVPRVAFPIVPDGVTLVSLYPRIRRELALAVKSPGQSPPGVRAFIRKANEVAQMRMTQRGVKSSKRLHSRSTSGRHSRNQ